MIDLEELAMARAQALSQSESDWLKTANAKAVAVACNNLSDGDIQQLFSCACSPASLSSICEGLAQATDAGQDSAFHIWKDHFMKMNIGFLEAAEMWHQAWQAHRDFGKCLESTGKPRREQ